MVCFVCTDQMLACLFLCLPFWDWCINDKWICIYLFVAVTEIEPSVKVQKISDVPPVQKLDVTSSSRWDDIGHISDVLAKVGKNWTFKFNASFDYSLSGILVVFMYCSWFGLVLVTVICVAMKDYETSGRIELLSSVSDYLDTADW